jgi:hypothetical protein
MPPESRSPQSPHPPTGRWQLRDWAAAAGLFLATAGVVLWQNAHVVVLWDASYTLDSAERIALGQMPYRDFPFVHAPLTFLIQAAIIRLTGRVFFHHVLYAAVMGGLGTVLAWRIVFRILQDRVPFAFTISLLLASPLTFLGVYSILPFPSYDCDCALAILAAVWCLQRLDYVNAYSADASSRGANWRGFGTGCAICLPLLVKQNMGIPFLLAAVGAVVILIFANLARREKQSSGKASTSALLAVLAGAFTTCVAAILVLHFTAGVHNYIRWTIDFAAERRMPGLPVMAGIYSDASLRWSLPAVVLAIALLTRPRKVASLWTSIAAFLLLAAPFLLVLSALFQYYDDPDSFGDTLVTLWPLLMLVAAAAAVFNIVRLRSFALRSFLPLNLLAAIHGTMLSQQLWGSTYAIWPLLAILIADLLVSLAGLTELNGANRWFMPSIATLIGVTLLVCGAFYTVSEERLSYINLSAGPVEHSAFPQLAGASAPGPWLPELDEFLRYAEANIPQNDGLILLPGEDPFYFITGREPQFPVLLFDRTTDPYSPEETAALASARNIRWLVVKRDLQIKEDVTPSRVATMQLLLEEFKPVAHLRGYDVYKRF